MGGVAFVTAPKYIFHKNNKGYFIMGDGKSHHLKGR